MASSLRHMLFRSKHNREKRQLSIQVVVIGRKCSLLLTSTHKSRGAGDAVPCRSARRPRSLPSSDIHSELGVQGTASHRRELKGVLSPKWLLIMPVLLASPSLSLASQASNTPGCRDGAAGDAPCRETAASGADTPGSARRCSCHEAAGRRDRH